MKQRKRIGFASAIAALLAALPLLGFSQTAPGPADKICGEVLAHRDAKATLKAQRGATAAREVLREEHGIAARLLDAEECALYVSRRLTDAEIVDLGTQGITVRKDQYVPPVPGRHPHGFYLAEVAYSALDSIRRDARFVRLESTEWLHEKKDDIGNLFTAIDQVHAGTIVMPTTGAGATVAVADSGIDLTHPDFPVPVEAFDMTDGTSPIDWGVDVSNTVDDHGTHVAGTVVASGGLSGGLYVGGAPAAGFYFYKIGDDITSSATGTDQIEAINRASALGVDVFSMSYGGYDTWMDGSNAICQAIDAATAAGMLSFISAGNEANDARHDSVAVAPATTSPTFTLTINNTTSAPFTAATFLRVIWIDNNPVDLNISLACLNLGGGESMPLAFSGTSIRGTEAHRYTLNPNIPAFSSKTYQFQLTNAAIAGTTPLVHLYQVSHDFGLFDSPDPLYTISNPAQADTALCVGAWVHRPTWTNFEDLTFGFGETLNTVASFSSRGPRVDGVQKPEIVAPGSAMISTHDSVIPAPAPLRIDNDGTNNGLGPADYFVLEGTSMACPQASGGGTLVRASAPLATAMDIRSALINTASNGGVFNNNSGFGMVDIEAAIISLSPTVTVNQAGAQDDPTTSSIVLFDAVFSDGVTGFDGSDVTIGGTALPTTVNVVPLTASTYRIEVSGMSVAGTVTATIARGRATGNTYGAFNLVSTSTDNSVTWDDAPPGVALSTGASDPTNLSPIPFTATFTEPVTGFALPDVQVTNLSLSNLAGGPAVYTFDATPLAEGPVSAHIPANVAVDVALNLNTPSTTVTLTYDSMAPTVALSYGGTTPTNLSPGAFTAVFSEPVTTFDLGDLALVNGVASNLNTADNITYTFDVTPSGQGLVSAQVPAGAAPDAAGNGNIASAVASFTYDTFGPFPFFSTAAISPTNLNPIPFTLDLDEPPFGFSEFTDLVIDNGTFSGFTPTGPQTADFDITPTITAGIVTAIVPANTYTDEAGNPNTTATLSIIYDGEDPLLVTLDKSIGQSDPTLVLPISFTIEFNEPVTNFTTADLDTSSSTVLGTLSLSMAGSGAGPYTVLVNGATSSGFVVLNFATLQDITDAAGNPFDASSVSAASCEYQVTTGVSDWMLHEAPR